MNQLAKICCAFFVLLLALSAAAQNADSDSERTPAEKKRNARLDNFRCGGAALDAHVDVRCAAIVLNRTERESKHTWNDVLPSVSASGSVAENGSWKDVQRK